MTIIFRILWLVVSGNQEIQFRCRINTKKILLCTIIWEEEAHHSLLFAYSCHTFLILMIPFLSPYPSQKLYSKQYTRRLQTHSKVASSLHLSALAFKLLAKSKKPVSLRLPASSQKEEISSFFKIQ